MKTSDLSLILEVFPFNSNCMTSLLVVSVDLKQPSRLCSMKYKYSQAIKWSHHVIDHYKYTVDSVLVVLVDVQYKTCRQLKICLTKKVHTGGSFVKKF